MLDRDKLAKVLSRTASSSDAEALQALRVANKMIVDAGSSWDEVVAGNPVRSGPVPGGYPGFHKGVVRPRGATMIDPVTGRTIDPFRGKSFEEFLREAAADVAKGFGEGLGKGMGINPKSGRSHSARRRRASQGDPL